MKYKIHGTFETVVIVILISRTADGQNAHCVSSIYHWKTQRGRRMGSDRGGENSIKYLPDAFNAP